MWKSNFIVNWMNMITWIYLYLMKGSYAYYLENWSNKKSWHLTNIIANKQVEINYVQLVILCT